MELKAQRETELIIGVVTCMVSEILRSPRDLAAVMDLKEVGLGQEAAEAVVLTAIDMGNASIWANPGQQAARAFGAARRLQDAGLAQGVSEAIVLTAIEMNRPDVLAEPRGEKAAREFRAARQLVALRTTAEMAETLVQVIVRTVNKAVPAIQELEAVWRLKGAGLSAKAADAVVTVAAKMATEPLRRGHTLE